MRQVTAVFSMRSNWLRQHPDAARLRIRVLPKAKFERISNGEEIESVLSRRYRRWVSEEGVTEHQSLLTAWEAAITKRDELLAQRRNVDLLFGPKDCRLYVFEMDPKTIEVSRFAEMNPGLPKVEEGTCAYVGMTTTTPQERYAQHRSNNHKAKTKWGQNYFLAPYEQAFRHDLLTAYEESGQLIEGLNTYEALKGELALRRWLQSQGIAAYSN